jgi:hypothetical protein
VAAAVSTAVRADVAAAKPTPIELFEDRILPIFKSPNPSSCVQCHLAAVDLKDYILPSQEKTFASLREQGLIDVANPEKSKILTLIRMGEKDLDKGARLIHEKTRAAEYEAFQDWIKACCNDPVLRKLPLAKAADRARPKRDDVVIRHARKSRVVESFAQKIWSQRMRCFPCHTPHELHEDNPKHRRPIEKMKNMAEAHGKKVAKRMRIFRETPEATLEYLIEDSRNTPPGRLPLINLENPRQSLIVLKPASKLPRKIESGREKPSYVEPVSHMGGLKMHVDDQSYKSFLSWIGDYANVVNNRYASVDELPTDNWYASKHVIMVRDAPKSWSDLARVQFFVFGWDKKTGDWQRDPVAFTQGSVTPRRRVAGALFLLNAPAATDAKKSDPESAKLAPGRYLIKAYLDSRRLLAKDPTVMLGDDDFFGQTEIQARWGIGFRESEKIAGGLFKSAGSGKTTASVK